MAIDQAAIAKELRPLNLTRAAAPGAPSPLPPPPDHLLAHHPHANASPPSRPQYYLVDPATGGGFSTSSFPYPLAAWPSAVYAPQHSLPNGFAEQAAASGVTVGAPNDGSVEEQPRSAASKKVKFLCSFGGKILPRPSDGALRYVGGHTRIIALRKNASFQELMQKMAETYGGPAVLKYQLPDEDLDALVTVSCAEDLENMMEEYDKLAEESPEGSAKLRVFLFSPAELDVSGLGLAADVPDTGQRYVDASNEIAEKEAAGMMRKESAASLTSTQTSDGVPAELLETPPAVASSGVAASQELSGSVFPDVPSDPLFSISAMTTVSGSAGIPSSQTLPSPKLEQSLPPSAGAAYAPPAYMDSIHDGFNRVEYIHNPGQVQCLNPQQLGAPVGFVTNPQHSYVPAVHVTAAMPAAQIGSGKPARAMVEPYLDDGSCGGRAVQVAANPTYRPFQAPSQFPPLPHTLLQTQNVERYGPAQVPPQGVTPLQTLRFEDCGWCHRGLPHVHSDTLMQEHGGSTPGKSPAFHSFHSEEMARSHVPLRVGHGAVPNSAVVHQIEDSVSPPHLGAYGYPQAAESPRDIKAVPYGAEHLAKNMVLHPQVVGFAGPVQAPYGVYLSNPSQAWHEGILQQQQVPLATPQYLLKQEHVINNPVGTNITSARNENSQNSELSVRDSGAESSYGYVKPADGVMGAPHLNHSQAAGLNEYRIPAAEPNLGDSALIEGTMDVLRISPSERSGIIELQKAASKINFSAQDELNLDRSPPVVEAMDNIKQNIVQADEILAETSVSPGRVAEPNSFNLVDILPSSTSEVTCIRNLQTGDPKKICALPGKLAPHSQVSELGSEPPIPHEWLLQGSSATAKSTISDWKDEASQLYSGNNFSDVYTPSTRTTPYPLSSLSTHNVHFGDNQEASPSESLFSNLEPWQIMHNTHLLPPKPSRVASKDVLIPRDSFIDRCSGNGGESNTAIQLEEVSYDKPLDSLIKNTCLDTRTTHPTEGKPEELIKQELQAVAEGVAASVLQQSNPVPELRSCENSSISESGRERAVCKENTDPQGLECHFGHKAEDIKTGQLDKANFGLQLMEDIGHLQIIRNSDLEELRELGSGTFGTVYHGKWRGSDVAIKRINDRCFAGKQSEEERLRADFWNEACKLADLHHPNVVAFYGIVLDGPGGSVATVTEYMVNGSLRQALQRNHKNLDRRKRILIAMDVAFGMEYLHGKNIVHFDLKSDNLLVNLRDPQRPICKVGDLGLSKVKCQTLISGGVRGTLPWMAPELLSGSSSLVSEKVDVFSFGIVMWELLTGEEPYADLHYGAIIGGIVNNTLRPPIPESCDPEWRSLMEKCWSTDPPERPSFTEIANMLRAMAALIPQKGQVQAQTSAPAQPQK